jgi:hypothetical protein
MTDPRTRYGGGQWQCTRPLAGGAHCGLVASHDGPCQSTGTTPAVVSRRYRGRHQSDAAVAFGIDAGQLAAGGYQPAGQSWEAPSALWPVIGALLALVAGWLLLGLIGAIAGLVVGLIVAIASPRQGTLTVTFRRVSGTG